MMCAHDFEQLAEMPRRREIPRHGGAVSNGNLWSSVMRDCNLRLCVDASANMLFVTHHTVNLQMY